MAKGGGRLRVTVDDPRATHCTLIDGVKGRIVQVYLMPGWHISGEHMATFGLRKRKDRLLAKLKPQLDLAQRCYCEECVTDMGGTKHAREDAARELVRHRALIAKVNNIPTDGLPKNEARIDAILKDET